MKLLSSQLFRITNPQIFVICWIKISSFYPLLGTLESVRSRNLPFLLRISSLGTLTGRRESTSQQDPGVQCLCAALPSPCQPYSGSWGFMRSQDAALEDTKDTLQSWWAGASHSWNFILFNSLENWMRRGILRLTTVLIHSINKSVKRRRCARLSVRS